MRIDAIPIGANPPFDINVVVEVPIGRRSRSAGDDRGRNPIGAPRTMMHPKQKYEPARKKKMPFTSLRHYEKCFQGPSPLIASPARGSGFPDDTFGVRSILMLDQSRKGKS